MTELNQTGNIKLLVPRSWPEGKKENNQDKCLCSLCYILLQELHDKKVISPGGRGLCDCVPNPTQSHRPRSQGERREPESGQRNGQGSRERREQKRSRILYSNVRGLISKINELKVIAFNDKPDNIMLTETWTCNV